MCKCKNIKLGSYDRQTSMKHNFPTSRKNKGWVCIDTCIIQEIAELWYNRIKTIESCCGHNKTEGYIAVEEKYINKMLRMKYKQIKMKDGRMNFFYPNTNYIL